MMSSAVETRFRRTDEPGAEYDVRTEYSVRKLDEHTFSTHLHRAPAASFQQSPQWVRARCTEWDSELLGVFDREDELVGLAAVRLRRLPVGPWKLAYVSHGPLIDWEDGDVPGILGALGEHLRAARVFAIRMVPPLSVHRWGSDPIREAIQDESFTALSQLPPDEVDEVGRRTMVTLAQLGWTRQVQEKVEDSQSVYNVWLPLEGVDQSEIRSLASSSFRRNVRAAERKGVEIVEATRADLPEVKRLYDETSGRHGFSTFSLEFLEALWDSFTARFPGRFHILLAIHEGDVLSVMGTVQTGRRAQAVLIANGEQKRQLKASNLAYDAAIHRAHADGALLYDFGGVGGSLDAETADAGLLRYKASVGGVTHEYLGTWDLPLNPFLYRAFTTLLPLYEQLRARRARR